MFQTIQWSHVPLGASGSSTIKVILLIPEGKSSICKGGLMLAPSQVYFIGISAPFSKALLETFKSAVTVFYWSDNSINSSYFISRNESLHIHRLKIPVIKSAITLTPSGIWWSSMRISALVNKRINWTRHISPKIVPAILKPVICEFMFFYC